MIYAKRKKKQVKVNQNFHHRDGKEKNLKLCLKKCLVQKCCYNVTALKIKILLVLVN